MAQSAARAPGPWRLSIGMLAFVLVAPVSLVGLPLAALLVAAGPRTAREWLVVLVLGGGSVALLLRPESGLLDAVTRAWIVLVSVAFAGTAAVRPAGFGTLAWRACLYAATAVAILGQMVAGPALWTIVQWDATRGVSRWVRQVAALAPPLYAVFDPAVRLLGGGWAVWLLLATLAGLALAWRVHLRLARTPLGPAGAAAPAPRPEPGARDARPAPSPGAVLNP